MDRVFFWIKFLGSCFGIFLRAFRKERSRIQECRMIERFSYDNRE